MRSSRGVRETEIRESDRSITVGSEDAMKILGITKPTFSWLLKHYGIDETIARRHRYSRATEPLRVFGDKALLKIARLAKRATIKKHEETGKTEIVSETGKALLDIPWWNQGSGSETENKSVITPYDSNDYPKVKAILEEGSLYYEPMDSPERMEEKASRDPNSIFVATDSSGVIGTASLMEDGRMAFIFRLAVAESHRGRGIGLDLMQKAEEELKRRGYKEIHILVEEENPLNDYYKKQGYVEGHNYRWMTKETK